MAEIVKRSPKRHGDKQMMRQKKREEQEREKKKKWEQEQRERDEGQKKQQKKMPTEKAVKRKPLSGYTYFGKVNKERFLDEMSEMDEKTRFVTIVGMKWKELSKQEQEEWVQKAEDDFEMRTMEIQKQCEEKPIQKNEELKIQKRKDDCRNFWYGITSMYLIYQVVQMVI